MLQMILKSMSVECNKTDMDNYAGEVDEEESGKFTFVQFCSVRIDQNSIFQGRLNVPGKKGRKLSKLESFPLINWELFVSCEIDWSKVKLFG